MAVEEMTEERGDRTLTREAALVCCARWQERLKLQDWQVLLDFKRGSDMVLEGKEATISRQYPTRIAWITLLDPLDYPADCALPQDHEVNIVHELLHLYMGYFDLPGEGPLHIWEEQAITAISQALVALDREKVKPPPLLLHDEDLVRCESCGVTLHWEHAHNWRVRYTKGSAPRTWCGLCQQKEPCP